MLTFAIAVTGYLTGAILFVFAIPYGLIVISGLELLTVFWMSARVNKMSVGAARGIFLFYAALNGIAFFGILPGIRSRSAASRICGNVTFLRNYGRGQPYF